MPIYKNALRDYCLRNRNTYRTLNSVHAPHVCLLNSLFGRRSKKTSKFRVTGLCVGNSPVPVNSPRKWTVTRKMLPFDDVIMAMYLELLIAHWWVGCEPHGYEVPTSRVRLDMTSQYYHMRATQLLVQQLAQANMKENIKTVHYSLFVRESAVHR